MAEESLFHVDTSLAELNSISFKRLEDSGLAASPGKIARLLLAILNENVSGYFSVLKETHAQALLSKATGPNVDLIGQMFNCTRNPVETDDDYKYRISKQNLSLAAANQTAVRLAVLSVEGVDDVVMRPYTRGTGSFSVYIVTANAVVDQDTLDETEAALNEIKAYGIRAEAYTPELVPIQYRARLIFDKKVVDLDQKLVKTQALQLVRDYISQLPVGSSFNPHEVRNKILLLSSGIYEVQLYQFTVNNRPALITLQDASWNERFVEASTPDAILVS